MHRPRPSTNRPVAASAWCQSVGTLRSHVGIRDITNRKLFLSCSCLRAVPSLIYFFPLPAWRTVWLINRLSLCPSLSKVRQIEQGVAILTQSSCASKSFDLRLGGTSSKTKLINFCISYFRRTQDCHSILDKGRQIVQYQQKRNKMSDPISQLGLTCPSGGNFYICQGTSTQFLGCCTSDPCEDGKGTCPQSDLRTSSFNESAYTSIQSQACASSSAGKWYTCSQLDTPFLGCCSTNACDSGCPTKDLVAAKLSDDQKSASVFETTSATVATASGTSGTSVPTSSSSASSNPSATATAATQNASTSGLSTGAKVGIVVSAAIVAIALLAVLAVFGRRYLKKRRGVVVTGSPPNAIMSNPTNSYLYHGKFHFVLFIISFRPTTV